MRITLLTLLGSFLIWGFLFQTQVFLNRTQSLPYKAFFCVKGWPCEYNHMVHLEHSTGLIQEKSLTKVISGIAGDAIQVKANKVWVRGRYIGKCQPHTRDGQKLTPIKPQIIPEGHVFVMTPHPRSLDSRYQEFGLVPQKYITSRCFGLWGCA